MLLTHLDQSEIDFLQQIKKELSLETNDEVIKRVAAVLQALRQTLTRENANELVNQLPDFLKLAFIGNWDKNEAIVTVNHLDELVSLIQVRDIRSGKNYFTSEVQILSIAILTLKKLLQFKDLKNFKGLSPYIIQQLNEISAEEIAA
ncbi:MAG: hypothetical protein DI538_19785 [Azospira oryzae]|jgi:uncharacterized protein (DUF2267 family)|nr:MAG: hypothetical protein DI538_19785 [Azospira oryzae]